MLNDRKMSLRLRSDVKSNGFLLETELIFLIVGTRFVQ